MKDITGNPIAVGDYLAYAVRDGDHAVLKIGRVLELAETGKVKVNSVERGWSGRWRRHRRVTTLSKLERTCRVRDVPEDVQELLQ